MKLAKISIFTGLILFIFSIFALGPDVSEYQGEELKWEDGARSYHVMFKSMLANKTGEADQPGNPQGDTCMNSSTYTLSDAHLPLEAFVDRAFLVWTSNVEPGSNDVDNKVNLQFSQVDGEFNHSEEIVGPQRNMNTPAQDFVFESVRNPANQNQGYYTYRQDITGFFKTLHEEGVDAGVTFDGMSLYGDYTLSNLDCSDDSEYLNESVAVSSWAIILVYSDPEIKPKMIYLYNGFERYFHTDDVINVTGFEFPKNPVIRLTLHVLEGDPGIATPTYQGSSAIPEALRLQGDASGWIFAENKCNPETTVDDGMGNFLVYTEIFNSVSSEYGYEVGSPIRCIGGIPDSYDLDEMEFGVDTDTFILNAEEDDALRNHFARGGTNFKMEIGANQDMVLTNFLIVSVDTKDPDFNIPVRPEKVACTPSKEDVDYLTDNYRDGYLCENTEFYYAIRVQNWGEDLATVIKVSDDLDDNLEYISGTTVYTNEFKEGSWEAASSSSWERIPDKEGGAFPLAGSGYEIAENLDNCVWAEVDKPEDCPHRYLVRYKVKVKPGIKKNAIVPNDAKIYAGGQKNPYSANKGLGVKLKVDLQCGGTEIEPSILKHCGGPVGDIACTSDDDCNTGESCNKETGNCELACTLTEDENIIVSRGENDPNSGEGKIVIPKQVEDVTLAQVKIKSDTIDKNKCLYLKELNFSYERSDSNVKLSNVRLIHDSNKNAKTDEGERQIASGSGMDAQAIRFLIPESKQIMTLEEYNYFIVVADAEYETQASLSTEVTFSTALGGDAAVVMSDGGEPDVSIVRGSDEVPGEIQFSTFMFEPDEGVIVTRGENNPINTDDSVSGETPVLQLKMLSKDSDLTLRVLRIRVPSGYVGFNEGIKELLVFRDNDGDGVADGDPINAVTSDFDSPSSMTVSGLDVNLPENEPVNLMIHCNFNMGSGEKAKIQISDMSLEPDGSDIYGLPVTSLEVGGMDSPNPDPDPCSCSTVSDSSSSRTYSLFMIFTALATIFASAFIARKTSR